MAYTQKFGRATTGGNGEPLAEKGLITPSPKNDFNKALYESSRNVQNITSDGARASQSNEVISNPKLTTFRPRGSSMYAQSLKDADVINPSFTKEPSNGNNSSYKFLSSRFLINPTRSDFADRQTDNTYSDGGREGGATTISEDKRTLETTRAKRGYYGVRKTLKEAEQGAKVSANISKNLQRGKESLNENQFKASIETARLDMRADPFLRNTRPEIKHPETGKYIISDEASYKNARMFQDYINQSRNATKAQNTSDKLKFITQDFKKDKTNGKFGLNSNNSSTRNIGSNNLFKQKFGTDITSGKKTFKF
tara:strand:+ start:64 stop:993 length:930 start_codon:yes stop_codon:yes gene_type:complete